MPELALAIYAAYGLLAFGLRSVLQFRATGSTGFKGIGGMPGSAEWIAGVGFVVAILAGILAPVVAILGFEPIAWLDRRWIGLAGLSIALAGVALTVYAQVAMGASWRIGVDPGERTELVVAGPFAVVRNPIFAAMLPTALGLTLMVPNAIAVVALAGLAVALELQVRIVEEPYLLRIHGSAYRRYAETVGRFVPGLGRLPADAQAPSAR